MADLNDRELLIRLDEQVKRLVSDIKSEKDTRARANQAVHEDIRKLRTHIDQECGKLSERIDQECNKLSHQLKERSETQSSSIKWLERLAWTAGGAVGVAGLAKLVGWVLP